MSSTHVEWDSTVLEGKTEYAPGSSMLILINKNVAAQPPVFTGSGLFSNRHLYRMEEEEMTVVHFDGTEELIILEPAEISFLL